MSNRIPEYKAEQLDPNLQIALLSLLAYSTKQGVKVAIQVPVELYDSGPHRELAKAIIAYRLKYHKAPRDKQMPILVDNLPMGKEQVKFAKLLAAQLENHIKGINKEFVVEQARAFAIRQNFKKQLLAAATEAHKIRGDNEVVRKIIYDALMYSPDSIDMGIKLSDVERSLAWLDQTEIVYPLGIPPLDKANIGLVPKGLLLYLAGKSTGKSWCCIHVGRQMLKQGYKVLHVTLEMSDLKVAKRYHQSFNSMSRNYDRFIQVKFERDKKGIAGSFETRLFKPKLAEAHPQIRKLLERKIEMWKTEFSGLVIKEFPSGRLTMTALVHYIDQLSSVDGFEPDVVIVDYPDLMKINPANQRLELGALIVDLRGLSTERRYAMFTPSQVNRQGMEAELVTSVHTSEAMLKVNTADTVITYSQTKIEKDNNLARLYANHVRDAGSGMELAISQAYPIGQFVIDAYEINDQFKKYLDGKTDDAKTDDKPKDAEPKGGDITR